MSDYNMWELLEKSESEHIELEITLKDGEKMKGVVFMTDWSNDSDSGEDEVFFDTSNGEQLFFLADAIEDVRPVEG